MYKVSSTISKAVDFLSKGGLVGIPTETVYGLAANALDAHAVAKIFEAKKRPSFDPLIVHIADIKELPKYVEIPFQLNITLAEMAWPGPLTLILPKKDIIPDLVTSGLDTVGIRVPSHPLTLELLRALTFPLAAPSANPFGYISPTTAQHVLDQLQLEVDMVLDGGPSNVGVESTIIEVLSESKIKILRWGGLDISIFQELNLEIEENTTSSSRPSAPGMLLSHYAPRKKFFVGSLTQLQEEYKDFKIASMPFTGSSGPATFPLSSTGDLLEASQNLFKIMRLLDESDFDIIMGEFVPNVGLGKAINDRLRRASFLPLERSDDES